MRSVSSSFPAPALSTAVGKKARGRRRLPGTSSEMRILLVIAVMALQAAMIAALVAQARRRRNAEQELAIQRRELAHFSRTSVSGELSGALAHELNQPLTSILANAEAGARLLEEEPADKQEIKEILSDIVAEDKRAAAVIAQLRRLMLKGETDRERVDLDQVVGATLALLGSELVARQTKIELSRDRSRCRRSAILPSFGNSPSTSFSMPPMR